MTANPITVAANASVADLVALMRQTAVNHVPVLADEMQVVGIISRDDLQFALSPACEGNAGAPLPSLDSLMTPSLLTVKPTDSIYRVVELMSLFLPRALVVMADNKLVGLVTARSLLDYLSGAQPRLV